LLNGLLVAYVGVDRVKTGKFRAALGRDVKAALRHQHQQTDGLETHRLAAGVRTGDHQRVCSGMGIDVDGDDGRRIKQGMACVKQAYGRRQGPLRFPGFRVSCGLTLAQRMQ
jgi:hypothetical protein